MHIEELGACETVAQVFDMMGIVAREGIVLSLPDSALVSVSSGVDLDGCTLESMAGGAAEVAASFGDLLFPDMCDQSVYPFGYPLFIPQSLHASIDTARTFALHMGLAYGNMPLEVIFHLHAGVEGSVTKLKNIVEHKWGPLFEARLKVC